MKFMILSSYCAKAAKMCLTVVFLIPPAFAIASPSAEFCAFVSKLRDKPCSAKVECVDQARNQVLKDMVCSCLKGEVAQSGGQSFVSTDNRRQISCCIAGALVRNPALCGS